MGEDISSTLRIGIAVVLLASLILSVTNIFIVVNNVYNEYVDTYADAMSDPAATSLMALNGVEYVGTPTVYKLLDRVADAIPPGSLTITWADGTVTSDYMSLLKNAWKNVKVSVSRGLNGNYTVSIKEVVN